MWYGDCDSVQVVSTGSSLDAWYVRFSGSPASESKQEELMKRKLITVIALCLMAMPALCQSASKWQVATITEIKPRDGAADTASDHPRYDISVKVGDTIYLVLYTQTWGEIPVKYATGHELLVLVGKDTITYNDMLGRSLQVPIESQRPASESKASK
jgi:hypothetical protein